MVSSAHSEQFLFQGLHILLKDCMIIMLGQSAYSSFLRLSYDTKNKFATKKKFGEKIHQRLKNPIPMSTRLNLKEKENLKSKMSFCLVVRSLKAGTCTLILLPKYFIQSLEYTNTGIMDVICVFPEVHSLQMVFQMIILQHEKCPY